MKLHLSLVLLIAVSLSHCSLIKQPAALESAEGEPAAGTDDSGVSSDSGIDELPEGLRNEPFTGDLEALIERRFLRVLVVPDRISFFFDGAQMRGVTYEAVRELERVLNQKFKTGNRPLSMILIPVRRDQILEELAAGRGDLAATRLIETAEMKNRVDFTDATYDNAEAVIVTAPGAPTLHTIDDLAGKEVYFVNMPGVESIADRFNTRLTASGRPAVQFTPADENLSVDDLLEMVNAGLIPIAVAERSIAELWANVFDNLQVRSDLVVTRAPLVWAVQKNTPHLLAAINDVLKVNKVGTSFGNTVLRRYLKNTKWINNATAEREVARFTEMVGLFRQYGDKYDFPYLLVTAQAYQESRLDHSARSSSGAVGVMQIKPETAAGHPVGIKDITILDRNIEAGVKYLRFLSDQYYANEPMDRINKGLFVLASYNAGPNRIRRLREEAERKGFDPNKWFNNVEIIASKRVGREPVQYVSNIFKYYLAYEMITKARSPVEESAR